MKKSLFVGIFLSLLSSITWANDAFKEGVNYEVLKQPQPVQTGQQIEVLELFWYRCPHCFSLEPYVYKWLETKPANADYVAYPAVLGESWAFHARAFFTFEALGVMDKLHSAFFDALHVENRRITNVEELANWAETQGVDRQAVIDAFDSFAVDTKTRHALQLSGRYKITGVPAFIVDGKYKTSVKMAGGEQQLFKLIDFLVDKAQTERSG